MEKKWEIKRNGTDPHSGQPAIVTVTEGFGLEYHGEWMGDEYVTLNVRSAEPVDFHFGDFVWYRGEAFSMNYDPSVVKKARRGAYGEGFTYDNIKLYATSYGIRTVDFKDVVLYDNGVTYTSLGEFSFYAESVEDLADRLQANFNRSGAEYHVYTPNKRRSCGYGQAIPGRGCSSALWNEYYSTVDDDTTLGERDVMVAVTKEQTCWDGVKLAYSQFGLSFFCVGYDIFIGADAIRVGASDEDTSGRIFRYGKNNGLYEIERTGDDDQDIVTKLYAYGSTENLPLNYYADKSSNVWLSMVIDAQHPSGSSSTACSVWLDDGFLLDAFTNKIFELENQKVYNVNCKVGDVSFGCVVEANRINAESPFHLLLIASVNAPYPTYGGRAVTQDVVDALNTLKGNGVRVYFTGGVDKSKWPNDSSHMEHLADYPALLSINRLMLPGFPVQSLDAWVSANEPSLLSKYIFSTEPDDPWIMSRNTTRGLGVIEGTSYFDGSDQQEVKPTIKGTGSDVIAVGSNVTDNGYLNEGADASFRLGLPIGLVDWGSTDISDETKIEMTSGYCTGCAFKVISLLSQDENSPVEGVQFMRLERDKVDNRYYPYETSSEYPAFCQVLEGDTFVVTGIPLPDSMIDDARRRLLIAACGWLDKRDHMRYTYLPKVDEIFMARQDAAVKSGNDIATYGTVSLHDTLKAGMQFQMEDANDLGIERYGDAAPFIDQLTIKEDGNNGVPTYDVVLRDEKEKGALERLADNIEDLTKDPPVQIVERQQRVLQYKEYDHWEAGTMYYYEALNADENRLETSRVRRWGGLWECRRTGTQEEPLPGCHDWAEIEACPVEVVEYDGWQSDMTYYYNHPNREKDIIETSRVLLDWCLWECRRTGTTDRPSSLSNDWVLIMKFKNYSADLSAYVDVITVDDVGNVIGGLWTDSGQTREYRIHSVITVRNHDDLLLLAGASEDAGPGTFKIHAEAHGCTYVIEDSTIYITSIAHLKDGVAGSGDDDWDDGDYERMRQMDSCWVDLVIDCEGEASIVKRFPVTIKHSSQPFISMDLSNQSSNVGWNTATGTYVGLPIVTTAKTWHNDERVAVDSVGDIGVSVNEPGGTPVPITFVVDPLDADHATGQGTGALAGLTVEKRVMAIGGVRTAVVRVTALPAGFPLVEEMNITCVVKYAGVRYERTLTHVINKTLDANVYEVLPQYDAVKGSYKDGTLIVTPSTLYVDVRCSSTNENRNYLVSIDNSRTPSLASLGLRLRYKRWKLNSLNQLVAQDSPEWKTYTTSGVSINYETRKVTFQLDEGEGSHIHDVEEVPVVIDGSNAISLQLDNDNDTCMVLEDGSVPDASLLPVAYARLYDGETPVDRTLIPNENNIWRLECTGCTAVIDGWKGHNDYSWITDGDYWLRLHVTALTADSATVRVCCTYTVGGVSEIYAHTLSIKKMYTVDKYDIITTPNHICYTPLSNSYSANVILVDVYQTTQSEDRHKMDYEDDRFQGAGKTLQLQYSDDGGDSWTYFDYYFQSPATGQLPQSVWNVDGVDNVHIRLLEKFSGEEGTFVWVVRSQTAVDIVADGASPVFNAFDLDKTSFLYGRNQSNELVAEVNTVDVWVKTVIGDDVSRSRTMDDYYIRYGWDDSSSYTQLTLQQARTLTVTAADAAQHQSMWIELWRTGASSYEDRTTISLVKAGLNGSGGESVFYADLVNEMSSVPVRYADWKTPQQYVIETDLEVFIGSTPVPTSGYTLTAQSTPTGFDVDVTTNKARPKITIVSGTAITEPKDVVLRVAHSTYGNHDVTFTVAPARMGADGSSPTLYELVPSVSSIHVGRNADNSFNPSTATLTCGYSKRVGNGTPTVVDDVTGQIDATYNVYFSLHTRGTNGTWSDYSRYYTYKSSLSGFSVTTYDAVEFIMCTNTAGTVSAANVTGLIDKETVPVVADGANGSGTSPIVGDLDNDNDAFGTDIDGNTGSSNQRRTTHARLFSGTTALQITCTCSIYYASTGSQVPTTVAEADTITYDDDQTRATIPVVIKSGQTINDVLYADIRITDIDSLAYRDERFTLTPQKSGEAGVIPTLYQLLPSPSSVSAGRTSGGGYSPENAVIKCGYTAQTGDTVTSVADAYGSSAVIGSRYRVFYRKRQRLNKTWESTWYLYADSEYHSIATTGVSIATYDSVEFILYANIEVLTRTISNIAVEANPNDVLDRENVPILADGMQGAQGGTGPAGASAVTYEIRTTVATALIPPNVSRTNYTGTFSFWEAVGASAAQAYECHWIFYYRKGTSYHVIGYHRSTDGYEAETHTLNGVSTSWWDQDAQQYVPQDAIVAFINNHIFDHANWSTTPPTAYQAMLEVPIMKNGDLGRMYYPAGEWTQGTLYARTDTLCPFVEYGGQYYYPIVDTPALLTPPSQNVNDWALCSQFGVVFTEALFADFGKLGSSIMSGDYQFSQYGWMRGFDDVRTEVNDSTQYQYADADDMYGTSDMDVYDEAECPWWSSTDIEFSNFNVYAKIGNFSLLGTANRNRYFTLRIDGRLYSSSLSVSRNDCIEWKIATSATNNGIASGKFASALRTTSETVVNFLVPEGSTDTYYLFAKVTQESNISYTGHITTLRLRYCKFVPKYVINMKSGTMSTTTLPSSSVRHSMAHVLDSVASIYVKDEEIVNVDERSTALTVVLPNPNAGNEGRIVEVLNPSASTVRYNFTELVWQQMAVIDFYHADGSKFGLLRNTGYTFKYVKFMCSEGKWWVIWTDGSVEPQPESGS